MIARCEKHIKNANLSLHHERDSKLIAMFQQDDHDARQILLLCDDEDVENEKY